MSAWYYSQEDRVVGPFQMEALGKLARAGVIDDRTLVQNVDEGEWQPLVTVLASERAVVPPAPSKEARYYYLDTNDRPVGPFDFASMHRLHAERVLSADTLVSGIGEPEWIPAARLLKLPNLSVSTLERTTSVATATGSGSSPRYLPFERYVLLTAVTLGFYPFYLVPCQSRDMKAITDRERMEFTILLILGIVTLGLVMLVMQVLYAFDLERHGKAVGKAGRCESLGVLVLVLNLLSVVLGFAIDSFVVGWIVGALLGGGALWLLQREINLYAAAPQPALA